MPKPKERMAGYIRFSDPSMPLDDSVMDSQAKAIREYAEKEGYIYDKRHEYREAVSAYMVSYLERPTLLAVLDAAKRGEFTVLVVTEIRSFARRQVEAFVLYDILQKYGVRLETITEKFEDSAIGRYILATRAMIAEVERENTYARLTRGKRHRLEAGNINGHNKPKYGYVFIDTAREAKAAYALNTTSFFIDDVEWTQVKVVIWMYDHALLGWSVRSIAKQLTNMKIPVPDALLTRKGHEPANIWHPSTVHSILTSSIYKGEVIANRYKNIENMQTKKRMMQRRDSSEWVHLPSGVAPAIVTDEVFEKVQKQLEFNKQDSLRHTNPDTPKEELGILRAGYCKCGICGRTMSVDRRQEQPRYVCKQKLVGTDLVHNHFTAISVRILDRAAINKIREIILDPSIVRKQVALARAQPTPVVNVEDIETTIANIKIEIDNLFELARHATNDSTRERLGQLMDDLEARQREAEAMLVDMDEDAEDIEKLEAEILRFEEWASRMREDMDSPDFESYDSLRLAVRVLGLTAIVYPVNGDHPFRKDFKLRLPEISKYLRSFCSKRKFDCLSPGTTGTSGASHR